MFFKISISGASLVAQRLSAHVPLQQPGVCQFGSQVWTWHHLTSHAVVGVPHIKQRKMGMDVSSGPVFLSRKRRTGSSQLRANLPQKKKKMNYPFHGCLQQICKTRLASLGPKACFSDCSRGWPATTPRPRPTACFCMTHKLRKAFILLNDFKKKEEEYFVIHESCVKFKFQRL